MQINPFGSPLGAGTQSASAFGGTGLGFIEALGLVTEANVAQPAGLIASPTPPANFNAKLSQTLLAQTQLDTQCMPVVAAPPVSAEAQPATTSTILPGLQQVTSLSQLMATAARLPVAEPTPAAMPAIVAARPETPAEPAPLPETVLPDGQPVNVTVEADVSAGSPQAPAPSATSRPAIVPVQADAPAIETEVASEGEVALEAAVPVAETAPPKPQKPRARAAAPEADLPQPAEAKPTIPAEMLAAVVPQQVFQQATRDVTAPHAGSTGAAIKKLAAAGTQPETVAQAAGASTTDFAGAIAARGESSGSEANTEGQAQPEVHLAAAVKTDTAAPHFPQSVHATSAADPVRAAAPVPAAEPVIEARANHLGHSLGVEIARKVELGEETLRIRLNPIELGRIEVTLAFDDKGSLQATVRTESAQAMDLLRQDAPDLARTLDQAGVRTDAQSFRFENRGGDSGSQQAQQQNQQSNRGQFASSDDDAIAAEPIYRPVRSDGQVDLLA